MSAFVDAVKVDIPDACHARKCRGDGCHLKLDGLGPARVLIAMDCDELARSQAERQRTCDFLFVGEGNWIVPIELKRGSMEASEVVAQLRAGAKFAEERILHLLPTPKRLHFRPVVAFRGTHPQQRAALRQKRNRIRFGGEFRSILTARCGDSLGRVVRPPNASATPPKRKRDGRLRRR